MIMSRQQNQSHHFFPGKIRKRGCSSSASSTSSVVQNYRFKRAILIGKRGGGGGETATPVPTWRLMRTTPSSASALRGIDSQSERGGFVNKVKQQQQQSQQLVSARKLAATLWEMNEISSPKVKEGGGGGGGYDERRMRREVRARERERERVARSLHSGSLPPHLSDPSHSPVSERIDRPGTGSRHRRSSSITQKLRLTEHNGGVLDSCSNTSLMEVETRSRAQTPSGSTVGVKTRLKDVSNVLTTSKELLKVINRMWGQEDQPSSMSLVSALHAELERACLQVNQLIHEQCSDQNEISYLMKCFAEEKAAWKNKEQEVVESAIESIAGELEVERKLRRRFESLNKKLGKELTETKASLLKTVKDLQTEMRAREVIEQVCDELARDISDDKSEVEEIKRESAIALEEVEKERELMQLADVLRGERAQMKLSEAKYQLEEKNAAVDKLGSQLENFLGTKKAKGKGHGSVNHPSSEEIAAYLSRSHFGSHQAEANDEYDEVEDGVECEEDSAESDLHSIELNMDDNNKIYNWAYAPGAALNSRKLPFDVEEIKGRKSTSGKLPKRSTSLQRSISDGVDWGSQGKRLQNAGNDLHWGRQAELDKQAQVLGYGDEMHGYKSAKGRRDQLLSSCRIGASRVYASPTLPSRDQGDTAHERPPVVPGGVSKSRLAECRGEGQNARKSRW